MARPRRRPAAVRGDETPRTADQAVEVEAPETGESGVNRDATPDSTARAAGWILTDRGWQLDDRR